MRCIQGSVYDVIADMRPDSPTYGRWCGTQLSAANRRMLYAPKGCAHGFITLEPDTELLYMVSTPYHPQLERGFKWNDPFFKIQWPAEPHIISERDRSHPDFAPEQA